MARLAGTMLERWTRWVIRHRLAVVACWLAVAVLGVVAAARLPALLTTSLVVPGSSSEQADAALVRHFGENPEGTFTLVFAAGTPSAMPATVLNRGVAMAARAIPAAHATALRTTIGISYGDVVTSLDLTHAASYTDTLRRSLTRQGFHPLVTGPPAIQHDLDPILAADLRRAEFIAVPLALLLLAGVLGLRAVLLVPLLLAGASITGTLALVYVIAHALMMPSYIPNLVELVGLGLSLDYSLLVVHRFREETASGTGDLDDALVRTMVIAGRTVLASGVAVAVGLSVICLVPVPFIRSMGIAGVVVPAVALTAAVTVQPALLSLLGRGGLRELRLPAIKKIGGAERQFWSGLARMVLRRRLLVLGLAGVLLTAMAVPIAWLQLSPGSLSGIPPSTESTRGLAVLRTHIGSGTLTPISVVIDSGAPGRARSSAADAANLRLARRLLADPEVFLVAIGTHPPYVDSTGRYGHVRVVARHAFGDESTQALVARLRRQDIPAARYPAGFSLFTGGVPAQGVDFLMRAYGAFPWVVLTALLLAYAVLVRALRSLILPLVALLLDLVTVAATLGLLVITFRFGAGADLLGLYQADQIEGWIPIMLFATLFGLSMDYQVFLVTRMREAWDRGAGPTEAIAHGIERTGRIVSVAAAIMVLSFSGFVYGRIAGLQELGAGLALGVLLDATVVRMLLMPSLIALLGRRCWWLPERVAHLLHVKASPLAGCERRGVLERTV